GLSSSVAAWAVVALVAAIITLAFMIFAVFIWLAQRYGSLTAALVLCGAFLLITIIGLVACSLAHRHTVAQARRELAARSHAPWLDPRYLGIGIQVARAIGWRRVVPLLAVGVLAAVLGREWLGPAQPPISDEDGVLPEEPARDAELTLDYRAA